MIVRPYVCCADQVLPIILRLWPVIRTKLGGFSGLLVAHGERHGASTTNYKFFRTKASFCLGLLAFLASRQVRGRRSGAARVGRPV